LASLPAGASTCSPRTAEFLHDFKIYLPCQRHDLFDTRTRTTSNYRFLHFAHASRHSMHPFRLSGTFRPFLSKGKFINRPSSPVPSSPHAFRKRSIGASLASSPAEAYLLTDRELQRFWCLRRPLHYTRNCGLQKLRSSFFGLMPFMFFMLVMFLMLFACTLF
jgi:hypothetical protein